MGTKQFQLNVPLESLQKRKCHCGSEVFIPTMNFYEVSAIVSPTGQAGVVMTEAGFVCLACSAPVDLSPAKEAQNPGLIGINGGKA